MMPFELGLLLDCTDYHLLLFLIVNFAIWTVRSFASI